MKDEENQILSNVTKLSEQIHISDTHHLVYAAFLVDAAL